MGLSNNFLCSVVQMRSPGKNGHSVFIHMLSVTAHQLYKVGAIIISNFALEKTKAKGDSVTCLPANCKWWCQGSHLRHRG